MQDSTLLPEDVRAFLAALDASYEDIFMTMYTSPCSACNGGKPRLVHRGPLEHRLGGELRRIVDSYRIGTPRV